MSPVLQKREAVGVGGTPETLPYSLPEVADKTLSLVATEATNVGEYFDFTIPTAAVEKRNFCNKYALLSIEKRPSESQMNERAPHH
jgi:hypothetical protein